ncbi:hypothetical protein [uncultured Desulfosarcina sp.]|uniref:hypothetical protein n=1 Tax=uncultured Desulfosarcina sp. TaxID=218289 RepID=UPI0029C97DEB|nr:hypothetical protein [uncultured Desulfosarcina sp.]
MTDSIITVNGDGLTKHLQKIMFDLMQKTVERLSKNNPREKTNSHQKIRFSSKWRVEHWRGNKLLAERIEDNLVPNECIDHLLDVGFSGGPQTSQWYLALFTDDHTPAATDTYAVPGFTETIEYDEPTRPAYSDGGVSGQSLSNAAAKATFTMTGVDPTLFGAAMMSLNTKGDVAGGGVLGPIAQFSQGSITGISDDDVIKVYIAISGSDV